MRGKDCQQTVQQAQRGIYFILGSFVKIDKHADRGGEPEKREKTRRFVRLARGDNPP